MKGPRLQSRRVKRALLRLGCEPAHKPRGGHEVYRAPNGAKLPVSLSHPEVPRNLVIDVCRAGGIEWDQFTKVY